MSDAICCSLLAKGTRVLLSGLWRSKLKIKQTFRKEGTAINRKCDGKAPAEDYWRLTSYYCTLDKNKFGKILHNYLYRC